jgi:hypothetical protein
MWRASELPKQICNGNSEPSPIKVTVYFFARIPVCWKKHTMKENESLIRQESPGPLPRSKLKARRKLKVEELGDPWRGNCYAGIRLKGKWLTQAGFHPGQQAAVILISQGIMQLQVMHGYIVGEGAETSPVPRQIELGLEAPPTSSKVHNENCSAIEFECGSSAHSRDIEFSHQGTISLFYPITQKGRQWLAAHCPAGPEHHYLADALAVEARYVADLLRHAHEDGLSV